MEMFYVKQNDPLNITGALNKPIHEGYKINLLSKNETSVGYQFFIKHGFLEMSFRKGYSMLSTH